MISVVIVNWNAGALLERCVRSLLEHGDEAEIILVDNASDDGSLEFSEAPESRLTVVRNATNLGFAAAGNQGWSRSRGKRVLFLNPDTECRPGSIRCLGETLLRDETLLAAGGLLIDPSGKPQAGFNVRSFPTVASVAADMFFLDEIWPRNPWTRRYRLCGWDHGSAREVDQPAGACLMVRRQTLEALGGFDERFHPAWFEDVDLCRRIRDMGGRILFQPAAPFVHHGASSLGRLAAGEFLAHYHTNQLRYFAKHHGPAAARRVRRLIVAGMYLRAATAPLRAISGRSGRLASAGIFLGAARHFSAMRE